MKRHNFGGLRATHGVSVSHRSLGSTGQRQSPGKTFKNKKMAGQLGNERVTTQSLEVVAADAERGLMLIKGSVPGSENGWVLIKDAVKRKAPDGLPFPAALREAAGDEPPPEAADAEPPRPPARRPRHEGDGAQLSTIRKSAISSWPRRCSACRCAATSWPASSTGSSPSAAPARTRPRASATSAARPRSPTSRRAPGGRARAACARRNSAAARSSSGRSCAATNSGCRRRSGELGLKTALSAKQAEGKLIVIDAARVDEAKTKALRARFDALGWDSVLIIDGAGRRRFRPRRAQPAEGRRAAASRAPMSTTSCAATRWS